MQKPNLSTVMQQAQTTVRKYWYVAGFLILFAGLFLVGSWYGQSKAASSKGAGSRRILHYVDPMNPTHTSPEPGLAPCGMKMEPVYADAGDQPAGPVMPPGSVKITPEKQQLIGVRVATVEKSPRIYTLRTVGKVALDETRVYRLNAFAEGWVERIYDNSTGSLVRREEPLAALYNKDLLPTLQSYYYATSAMEALKKTLQLEPGQAIVLEVQQRTAEKALMNLGMSKQQIQDLACNRQLTQEIILSAPVTSFVLARNITPGQKFNSGDELYRLGDLSRVWILADLFENEAKYILPGEKVRVTIPHQDEKHLATVSEVLPQFDPATLTLKVRLVMDNPKFALRPGMFVDVEFPINLPPTVNVPVEAVMDSGAKKTVFVDRGKGYFEPRRVKAGWCLGDRIEIVEGLAPGDRIATSGNFLIDSESRLKLAAAGMYGEVTKDPVCGLNVDESKAKAAGLQSTFKNQTFYFCSEECQKHFDKNPERFVEKPGEVPKAASSAAAGKGHDATVGKSKDAVCGQEVEEAQAKAAGLTSEYEGKTYYFCSYRCNKQFDKDPARYLKKEARADGGAHKDHQQAAPATCKDPVCGLEVTPGKAQAKQLVSEYQGKTYYFDTEGCKQRFDKDPKRYLSESSGATTPQTYLHVPTDATAPLLYHKNLMRSMSQGPMPEMPHGVALEMPQGPAQVAPPGTPPVAPSAVPPGAAQVKPPPAMPPATAPVGPQAVPPGAAQVAPLAVPRGPSPSLPRGLRNRVPRGPTSKMREKAAQAKLEREAEKTPQGPTPVAPQEPQVKPQVPSIPPAPAQVDPQGPPPGPPQAQPLCPPGGGGHQHD